MKLFATSNLLLKHQPDLFKQILEKKLSFAQLMELLVLSLIGLALFGAVMSLVVPDWWHALALTWKMIVLIFGSNLLCLPALYVFTSIRGSHITLLQLVSFLLASIATTAVVLLSLAPISWFFTWSMNGEADIVRIINTLMIGFGIVFGIILLARGFTAVHKHYKATVLDHKSGADILLLWLILVIIVTVQMGNKLGPWYRLQANNETCQGAICFPYVADGEFTKPLEVNPVDANTLNVVSAIDEGSCGFGEIYYRRNTTISSIPTNCYNNANGLECAAVLNISTIPSGTTIEVQTRFMNCSGPDYVSTVATYTKK